MSNYIQKQPFLSIKNTAVSYKDNLIIYQDFKLTIVCNISLLAVKDCVFNEYAR